MYADWDGARGRYSQNISAGMGHVRAVLRTQWMEQSSRSRSAMAHKRSSPVLAMASRSEQREIDSTDKK